MFLLETEVFAGHPVGYMAYTHEELIKLRTRQLLKALRSTYGWDYGPYGGYGHSSVEDYRNNIKAILSTREHIPNKQESKAIRKLRKKKGN